MIEIDPFTIGWLYDSYHRAMDKIEKDYKNGEYTEVINGLTITDWNTYYADKEYTQKVYIQAMILVTSIERLSFAYFVPVEEFIQDAMNGSFNEYDGNGFWIDWNGNEIDRFSWEDGATMPDNAIFVAWYNK